MTVPQEQSHLGLHCSPVCVMKHPKKRRGIRSSSKLLLGEVTEEMGDVPENIHGNYDIY